MCVCVTFVAGGRTHPSTKSVFNLMCSLYLIGVIFCCYLGVTDVNWKKWRPPTYFVCVMNDPSAPNDGNIIFTLTEKCNHTDVDIQRGLPDRWLIEYFYNGPNIFIEYNDNTTIKLINIYLKLIYRDMKNTWRLYATSQRHVKVSRNLSAKCWRKRSNFPVSAVRCEDICRHGE